MREVKRYSCRDIQVSHWEIREQDFVLAFDYGALQRYHEDYKASMLESFAEINAVKEEALQKVDALQKENEIVKRGAEEIMRNMESTDRWATHWRDRAERAERELAEAREKYQHTEDEKNVLSMDLAMALERERECEEAILCAMPLMDDWDESREWRELPAVARALARKELLLG